VTASWDEFENALARDLASLVLDARVNLHGGRRIVMFAQTKTSLYAQTSGNDGLPAERQMSPEEEAKLLALGWEPPGLPSFPDWTAELPWPATVAQYRAFASMLVRTLRECLGVNDLDELEYQAWDDNAKVSLRTPALAMLRESPDTPFPWTGGDD